MKYAFIVDSGAFGGAERQALILAKLLKEKGNEAIFICLNKNNINQLGQHLEGNKIPFYDLNFTFKSSHIGRLVKILDLSWQLRKFKIDVLLPYTIRPNVNINFSWQLTGAKLCIWNQRDIGHGFGTKYRDKILWFALKNTSGFVSNSLEGRELLREYIPKPKKIKHITNGINILEPRVVKGEVLKAINAMNSPFVALMIANLTRYKDHKTLLNAWEIFLNKIELNNKPILLLAGSQGDTYQQIMAQISEMKLSDSVRVLGSVNDVNSLIHASDLCLFSSRAEGVPNGVLEAMAAEKPVIASDIKGNREALGDEYSYFFEVGNAHELADQIMELFNQKERQKELGLQNKERISANYSIEKLLNSTVKFVKELNHG